MTPELEAKAPALIRVVLVEPQGGANVGSVCRAIENTGGGQLAIVGGTFDETDAKRMAVHAGQVLADALRTERFDEAIAGCALVVGTTARGGPYRDKAREVRSLASEVWRWQCARERGTRIALVFGREDRGLSNDEIAACHWLARIPTSPRYESMNLAQAAMVLLYELMQARLGNGVSAAPQAGSEARDAQISEPVADAAQVESMFQDLRDALDQIGFLGRDDGPHVMRLVRSLLGRAAMDAREVRLLRGVARQIRWFATDGREVLLDKQARGESRK